MRRPIRKLSAFLCCLLCILSAAEIHSPVFAESSAPEEVLSEESESVPEEDITLSVSIFENVSRDWILPPMQLDCPAGTGLSGLMNRLVQYAYLEGAAVRGGRIISLTDSIGRIYSSEGETEENGEEQTQWLLILNGMELTSFDEESGMTFSDGDTLQLVYSASSVSNTTASAVSAPSRSLSDTTHEFPWSSDYDAAITAGCGWLKSNSTDTETLTVLGAAGYSVDYKYLSRILRTVSEQENPSALELAQDILSVSFSGISAENFSGKNLLQTLSAYPDMGRLDTVYGLLAYDCNGYTVSADALNSRDAMINVLMAGQNEDGGIAEIQGEESDVYLTALSLAALAPYRDDESIGPCIERALTWLSGEQHSNGLYYNGAEPSCRETSAVILALGSLSVSLADSRFSPDGKNMLDALMRFYTEGTGFSETRSRAPDAETTRLSLLALCSQKTHRNPLVLRSPVTGNGSLDFSASEEESTVSESEEENEAVRSRFHSGLIGAVLGGSAGIISMLGLLLYLKEKHEHPRD